jgi:hypothetical protein
MSVEDWYWVVSINTRENERGYLGDYFVKSREGEGGGGLFGEKAQRGVCASTTRRERRNLEEL